MSCFKVVVISHASGEKVVRVAELHELFNREAFFDRVQRGELIAKKIQGEPSGSTQGSGTVLYPAPNSRLLDP